MDPLTLAARWNNWGIQLLLNSHSLQAMETFLRAAHLMRDLTDVMTHNSSQHEHVSAEYPPPMQNASDRSPEGLNTPAYNFSFRTYKTRNSLDKGVFYVYNRPFVLPTSCGFSTSNELAVYLVTSSAVIAFNYAIACHQLGKISGQTAPLQRSKQSYNLVIRILQRVGTQQEFGKFLTCLALNNLANIHTEICNFENSERCLERLRNLLGNDPYIQEFASEFMDDAEWSNLELNVMCSQCTWSAQAA
jgi:hypothetical protein